MESATTTGNGRAGNPGALAGTARAVPSGSSAALWAVPEATVSLRRLRAELWRRRRLWIATALAGLLIGSLLHLAVPRRYSAQSTLYLVQPAGANPAQVMASDMTLLTTRAVAQQAIDRAHLGASVTSLLSSYRGSGSGGTILTLTTSASSSRNAVTWNDAVARAFLAYRAAQFRQQTQVLVGGLRAQIAVLQRDVAQLGSSINGLTGAPGSAAGNQVTSLTTERTADITQIAQLEAEVQQDQLDAFSVTGGSRVLDPAVVRQVSALEVVAADALTGLVAGLGAGILVVLVAAVVSDRPRYRQEIALALQAPVELSIPAAGSMGWRRGHRHRSHPVADEETAAIARALRRHLDGAPGNALIVVTVDAADVAVRAIVDLAGSLAGAHRQVQLADLTPARALATFLGKSGTPGTFEVQVGDTPEAAYATLVVAPWDAEPVNFPVAGDVDGAHVALASVDPALGADHLAGWGRRAVMLVHAGHASTTLLGTTANLLRHAEITVSGAILIGADPRDATSGQPDTPRSSSRHHAYLWERRISDPTDHP